LRAGKLVVTVSVGVGILLGMALAKPSDAGAAPTAAGVHSKYFNPDPARFLFENKLRPGMIGYGLTVMRGAKIQKFKVKIIDVIKDFQPDMNVILVRCYGLGLQKSGIIEGMSGSPVYIDGKLIGAIAYGWPYSKDPIGGVQPIRQMLRIPMPNKMAERQEGGGSAISWLLNKATRSDVPGFSTLISRVYPHQLWTQSPARRSDSSSSGGIRMLSTPLMISSADSSVLRFLRQGLRGSGLTALSGGGAGVDSKLGGEGLLKPGALDLRPGAAISVPLMSGDMDMCAIGTVTAIVHDHVYAFGHRFFAQGPTHLPVAGAYIFHVLPIYKSSFKLGDAAGPIQGSLLMDQETGIMGILGPKPASVPITVRVEYHHPTWVKVFHYNLYPNRNTTVESIGAAILGSMAAKRNLTKKNGKYTVHISGDVHYRNFSLPVDYRATTGNFDPTSVLLPIAILNDNPFHDLAFKSMDFNISIHGTSHAVSLISASVARRVVKPGGTLVIYARLRPEHQHSFTAVIRLVVPVGTPKGVYNLQISSRSNLLIDNASIFPQYFTALSTASLKRSIRYITSFKSDRLYAQLVLNTHGLTVGSTSMPNLPASRLTIMTENPPANVYPLPNSIATSVPLPGVLAGGEIDIPITVRRHPFGRFAEPIKTQPSPMPFFPGAGPPQMN
jgi:hypothetical protein